MPPPMDRLPATPLQTPNPTYYYPLNCFVLLAYVRC